MSYVCSQCEQYSATDATHGVCEWASEVLAQEYGAPLTTVVVDHDAPAVDGTRRCKGFVLSTEAWQEIIAQQGEDERRNRNFYGRGHCS